MKQVYVNSHLRPLPVAVSRPEPRQWIFTGGDKWLLLTPPRLLRIAILLGLEDGRVSGLLGAVRRWHPHPERFCRALGVEEASQVPPRDYPPAVCPECGNVHNPHPEEAAERCSECAARERPADTPRAAEKRVDARVRARMLKDDPGAFEEGALNPFWRMNRHRRLERDWSGAVNRILLGRPYREVAREFNCSVGVLHKKVTEARSWEWN